MAGGEATATFVVAKGLGQGIVTLSVAKGPVSTLRLAPSVAALPQGDNLVPVHRSPLTAHRTDIQ